MGLIEGEAHRKPAPLLAWLPPAVIATVSAALLAGGDPARELLRFDRPAIAGGELWRLLTGHLVHLGASHCILNVAGLGLVWYLVGDAYDWRRWTLVFVVSVAFVDAGLGFLEPGLQWYVGLSGVLHGLLVAGIVGSWTTRRRESQLLAILVAAKLAWEQFVGPLPGSVTTSGGAVIVDAHLYGVIGGLLAGLCLISLRRGAPI